MAPAPPLGATGKITPPPARFLPHRRWNQAHNPTLGLGNCIFQLLASDDVSLMLKARGSAIDRKAHPCPSPPTTTTGPDWSRQNFSTTAWLLPISSWDPQINRGAGLTSSKNNLHGTPPLIRPSLQPMLCTQYCVHTYQRTMNLSFVIRSTSLYLCPRARPK
jgi:hypothetical protein